MNRSKKKAFDWYGMRQHFSIRKYHFGAASVLLGMSLALGAGAQAVQAEETLASSETTTATSTLASSTEASAEVAPSTTTETSATVASSEASTTVASTTETVGTIDGQTVTSAERVATINYIVTYVLEDGTLVNASVNTATINTTDEVAKATIPVFVSIPEGYELASGQSSSVTLEVTENGQNVSTVKVVKKAEAKSTTTTESTSAETAVNETTNTAKETKAATSEAVAETVKTPATVEEAKVVLEQVTSEAELLTKEAERLVAADSSNEALKTVASATRLAVSEATAELSNSAATLETVNAQIDAVRSNVEALVLELRKFSETGDIVVMLATTSTTGNLTSGLINQGPGSDFQELQTSGQGAIADGFTVTPDMDDPAGASITRPYFTETDQLKNDPTTGRYTFLVSNLDPYTLVNETDKRRDLYMTVSRDMTDPSNTDVFVRIVDKTTQELLGETTVSLGDTTKVLNGQIENVTITVPNPATNSYVPHTLNFTATYETVTLGGQDIDRLEFYFGSAEATELRTRAVWQSNGLVQKGDPVHKLWSYVPRIATQTTYYRVQGTEELIAKYTIKGLEGDVFTSSTKRDVTNYEYVSGEQESGLISKGYEVGTTAITVAPPRAGYIERRVKTFVSEDGDVVITIQRKAAGADDSTYETVYSTGVVDNLKYWTAEKTLEGYDATRAYSFPGKTAFWTLYNEFSEANVDTTFYYTPKGAVEVFYVDDKGKVLQDSKVAVSYGDTGSNYDTVPLRDATIVKEGVTYFYKNIDGLADAGVFAATTRTDDSRTVEEIDAETGTVASNTIKELTYVYVPAGHVNINYVNEAGDVIKAKVVDTVNGEPGTTYDATQDGEKPTTIVAEDGKTYTFKEVDVNSASPTGDIEAGVTKEVTYVYSEVKGNVVVHYKLLDGTEISPSVNDTVDASTGTTYDTTDKIEETITTADGKVYKRIPKAVDGAETGTVVVGTTEVTYYYELVTGDVVVNYVNTDGKVIASPVVDTDDGDTGSSYDTTDNKPNKIIEDSTGDVYYILPTGSEIQAGSAAETGKVVEGTTEVTYVYEKAGNVVVNYTLADGTVIKDPVKDETNAKPGSPYDTKDNKPETITTTDGKVYKLVPNATKGNETGDVEAGKTTEVTYIYEEVKSDVVVEYYNTAGEIIAKTVVDEENKSVGTDYNTDEDNRPETITATDGTVYYYKEVKDTSAPTTGKVAEATTTVQYVYEKAGDVIVHYIATDGTPISGVTNVGTVTASTVDDTVDGKPGSTYDTSDLRPTTITTDEGKTYELVPTATIGDESGKVESGVTKEVTYVYKEVKGSVVVNYISTTGEELQAQVVDTPESSTGTEYNTTDVKSETITTKDGRTFKLVPQLTQGTEKGEVVPGVTEVTYVYEEVKGDVVVNYVNTAGEVIAPQVVDTKTTSTGTDYDTKDNKPTKITAEDGTVYYYKEVDAKSAAETGKVVEGTTEVTYVYEPGGSVTVNYVTTDGKVIKSPVKDEENAEPGKSYSTEDNKPTTITTEDGKTYKLVPNATKGEENGTVTSGEDKQVTYVYEEVKGNVVVEYYNTAGEKIATDVEDTPASSTGTAYTTLDHKPAKITATDGTVYYYKEVKADSAAETGDVVEGTTTVKYVYEPAGSVTVNYVTTDGTVIKSPVKDEENAEPGKTYSTEDNKPTTITTEDGKTYKLVPNATKGEENGTVTSGEDKQVTYVYEEVKGSVVVNYIDTEGNVIKAPVTDTPSTSTGTAYDTTDNKPETITTEDGTEYKLVPVLTKGNENGSVVEGTTQVTYVYQKVTPVAKTGIVVVEYYNTAGEKIATDVVDTPETTTGTVYETLDFKPATITKDGVTYFYKEVKDTSAAEKGTVVEGTTTVQYVYEPAGSVTVNYVTTDGKVIKTPVKDEENAEPGKTYSTEDNKPTTITTEDGKTYKLVPSLTTGEENGSVTSGEDKQVTYVYEEVKGDVVVNYIDTEGNVIKAPVTDTASTSTGTAYDTTDNKPETITTEDGTEYKLVPVLTKGNENGSVVEGTTQVTYVYQKVTTPAPNPNGSVVVNYVNTNGETIATSVNDTTDAALDTAYDTTDYKPAVIKHNGVTYYYKEVKAGDSETGKVVEGTTSVTYVYEPAGSVTVNYVTTDGTVIKTPVKDEENAEPGKTYSTEDNKPTTITTEDGKTYKLVPSLTTGEENGSVTSGEDKQVTYVYEEVKGNVVVNYIDTEGNVIASPVEDTASTSTGTSYNTTDNKPTTITTADGSVYEIVPVLTQGNENGSVVEGTTQVTYVYRKVSSAVKSPVTNHVDENGKTISPQEDGTKPNTSIPGYEFTGKTTVDEDGNVTHVYRKVTPKGTVVVNYVTEDGTVIKAPVQDETNVPAGKSYDTTDNKPTEIVTEDGSRYVLIPSKTIGTENGTVEGGKTTEITYVYKKVANWIPEIPGVPENERPVIPYPFDPNNPDVPVTPTPGTVVPNVPGYTPVDPKDNTPLKPVDPNDPGKGYVPPTPDETGKDTPIPYVQNGNVVVNYVTEDGTVIKAPVQDETNVPAGKSYDTTDNKPNTITTEDGTTYELVRVDGSETGTVVGGKTTEVTYVYRKVTPAKKVVTNHVDENGNPIAPQEEGTTPNKSIPGYEFTGKTVTDPDGNTTHIYRKVETPAKKVVTNHVDENGNPIAPQEEGTTPNKSIPGYEFTGKTVTDPDGNTTHIYRKVETPAKKVVTNHVDENGNPIAPQEDGTTPNKSIPGYEFTGKTYTDGDGNTYHVYRKVSNPVAPKPQTPATPAPQAPATPKPQAPAAPATPSAPATTAKAGAAQLPNTGEASSSAAVLGAGMLVAALALAGKRRRNED